MTATERDEARRGRQAEAGKKRAQAGIWAHEDAVPEVRDAMRAAGQKALRAWEKKNPEKCTPGA